jgi:hypothetical protein
MENADFIKRAQTKIKDNVRITASVPSADESKKIFGVNIYNRGIQPIWLEIENKSQEPVWFFPFSVDPGYYSPLEAAFANHFSFVTPLNYEMNQYFFDRGQRFYIAPGYVRSGFVYSLVDEGTKEFNVDIFGYDSSVRTFTFFIDVPGLKADHHQVDFETLYSKDDIVSYDADGLRDNLEKLPCCTTNQAGTDQGDPLNLIIIGDNEDVFYTFIRAGWDETETVYTTSAFKTAISFISGGEYRYSPVSRLFVFGRSQDIALQKARKTIHERNHLRLWLTPIRYEGKQVWIGQISRDIGVRFSSKTIVTHKIDPDVDETRDYLIQNLLYSQGVVKLGFVKGVGTASIEEPRSNLTGDPYFTDGLRAVIEVSSDPIDFDDVEFLEWETPYEK